ncbi:MAG: antibiotic biosynthesis monooxygenase [Verrucomicrobiota bacterium]
MYVTLVHVLVKKDRLQDFIEITRKNHEGSVREPGNKRFDILQSAEDPCRFVLYEAYSNQQDAAAHKSTPHYQAWKETVADWMVEPRKGVVYKSLFPK